jgi:hypothetical protein
MGKFYSNDILDDLQSSNIKCYNYKPVFLHIMYDNNPFSHTTQNKKTFSVLQTVPLSQEKSGIKTGFPWHCKF